MFRKKNTEITLFFNKQRGNGVLLVSGTVFLALAHTHKENVEKEEIEANDGYQRKIGTKPILKQKI